VPTSLKQIVSFIASYKGEFDCSYKLLLIAVTLPVTSASGERSFSKMNLVKTLLRNSMTSERLSNIDLLSIERVRAEQIDLYDFVDEFDIRHDNRKIKSHWVDVDMKLWRPLRRDLCEDHIAHCIFVWILFFCFSWGSACFAYGKTVINHRRWRTFSEIFCKASFTLAVTSCYQAHATQMHPYLRSAVAAQFLPPKCLQGPLSGDL